ncbi:SOS response-associated peptidase [Qipengyuania seohaensis]|uniref:SOS response-associated peptidase n=1 Tax=Qipengyuania seohaensis TaxID=266951 RepID=UPI000C221041|nr:SOS response-associated peptidase family protein [Qipengyuania seohaensis]
MCNLYRMTKAVGEAAAWFDAVSELDGANFGDEVFPGYPGAVIADGRLRQMTWGFPLVLKSKRTGEALKPKPINNARADKLDTFFWRYSFEARRCLIPVTGWAEAEGATGRKTRTWLTRPDAEIFAVAGIWCDTDDWGAAYSMVMTDSVGLTADLHARMPVLLSERDWRTWTHGPVAGARELCRSCKSELSFERTNDRW